MVWNWSSTEFDKNLDNYVILQICSILLQLFAMPLEMIYAFYDDICRVDQSKYVLELKTLKLSQYKAL